MTILGGKLGRLFKIWYAIFVVGALALLALGRVNDGNVLIMSFEGDALHMALISLRMAAGEIPHLDFQTPLGAMAFLPIKAMLDIGYGIGLAFAYAPVMLGIICLPALYWIGISRFSALGALVYAIVFLVLLMTYLHGGTAPTVAASMYYNNWCWAIAMLVVATAILPGPESHLARVFEGLILGAGFGFLALTKATYAVFLLPAVVLALVIIRDWLRLGYGFVFGVLFLALVTLPLGGIDYWIAYVNDLQTVMNSSVRQRPGLDLAGLLVSPQHIAGVIALLAAVVFLRQARKSGEGLVLLVLGAGWVLITHQNWQNDPHWMAFSGLLLFAIAQDVTLYNRLGWPLKEALRTVAVGLIFIGLPMTYAQTASVLVHNGLRGNDFAPALIGVRNQGLRFQLTDTSVLQVKTPNPVLATPVAKPTVLGAETLPECGKENGLIAALQETGRRLDMMPETFGKSAVYADWVNAVWLFSNLEPVKGGAPWYYGGTPGFENADYLVVPLCPMGPPIRRIILAEIASDPALNFSEVGRDNLFILLARQR